ncbi:unnamed protein product [Oikopleura dioica]|uniref:RING-type domain-containing protein n=1 Tax=Oikopleura dioica TaxID=34765 RepID=E4YD75_OIKDI|nr:unnamed protein product [Oikopleura dioica]
MNLRQNDDITATTREAIRLVDQYESDEAYARRLHEELNGGVEAVTPPARRSQPCSFAQVDNRIDAPELQRHLSISPGVDEMIADLSEQTFSEQDDDTETVSNIQIESTDTSDDDNSSNDDGVEIDERLHQLFAGLLNMVIQGRNKGLTSSQIEQLPTQKLREAFKKYNCPVCMDDLAQEDQVRRLPCLHILHSDCIDPWLKDNNECPTCKFDISSIFENNDTD